MPNSAATGHLKPASTAVEGMPMTTASLRLEHSRQRIRRYLYHQGATDQQARRRARSRRNLWLVAAVLGAVAAFGLTRRTRPRGGPGLAGVMALAFAWLKAPGALAALAGQMDTFGAWWHRFSAPPAPPTSTPDRHQTPETPPS